MKNPDIQIVQPKAYDFFIAVTAIIAVSLIAWRIFLVPESETAHLIDLFDLGICSIFFIDFIRNLCVAKSKSKYMMTWGPIDLISSIPLIQGFRWARLARLIRIVRSVKSIHAIIKSLRSDYRQAIVIFGFLTAELVIIGSCFAVLHFESQDPTANLTKAGDVLWWSIVTMSTVGYGDFYPVTVGGRFFAVLLMLVGIGLFAMLAGVFADVLRTAAKDISLKH